MIKSLLADLRATSVLWPLWVGVFLLFNLFSVTNPAVHLISWVFLALALVFLPLIVDDFNRIQPLMAALPVSRGQRVAGRYLFSLLAAGVGLVLARLEAGAVTHLFIRQKIDLSSLLGLDAGVVFMAMTLLAAAFFLPFYYRWGLGKGLMIATASILIIVIALTLMAPRLESVIRPDSPLVRFLMGVMERLWTLSGTWSSAWRLLAGVSGLYLLSLGLAVRIQRRRDL